MASSPAFTLLASLLYLGSLHVFAQKSPPTESLEKAQALNSPASSAPTNPALFLKPDPITGNGHRTLIGTDDARVPVVVVRGTPYEMGWHLGRLMRDEIHRFMPATLHAIEQQLGLSRETLREVWARTAAYSDNRVAQELAGLADGSGLALSVLQAAHAIPLLMPYSCSSIAAWGEATENGHLLQTRNLDWNLAVRAHDFPVVILYVPNEGTPHVVPSFAGMIGAHTGMNAHGIALSEMGDSSAREMPYFVHASHFTVFFRTMLYDATSLADALDIFRKHTHTKRYHYVFGDGKSERRAVKVRAHSPEPNDQWLSIWTDNDPTDEFAPNTLSCVVYNDEGRGAFPYLKKEHGRWTPEKMIELANRIPIKGGNVINVVYDATALQLWVSYAKGDTEAYLRPYNKIDLTTLDIDADGIPDLPTISAKTTSVAPSAGPQR